MGGCAVERSSTGRALRRSAKIAFAILRSPSTSTHIRLPAKKQELQFTVPAGILLFDKLSHDSCAVFDEVASCLGGIFIDSLNA